MATENIDCMHSTNGEEFYYDTLEELIGNSDLEVGDTVYRGEKRELTGEDLVTYWDVDNLLERIGENAWANVGECAEDYPQVPSEKKEELIKLLRNWVEENCKPNFYHIEDICEVVLTEEDFEEVPDF